MARFFKIRDYYHKKKKEAQNERINFAIFSYKIAMQIYFKSLIAPNMLLSVKTKNKQKNQNPYSTRWPLKNDSIPKNVTKTTKILQNI